ncbi:DUF397 domain-containing protein [Streptomyces sp. NPDC059785]|uniref:DUF397 domain-containing protein n=1 Tax=unclassified Streptomyces TaxID=2593676 RepID=UPI0036659D7B
MPSVIAWQKSSFSGGDDSSNCVEVAATRGARLLRESDQPGTVLSATGTALAGLIRHLREQR